MNELIGARALRSEGLVREINGKKWTTSLVVAEKFEKEHKDVLRSINSANCSTEFSRRNFAPSNYLDSRGKSQSMIMMTEKGFSFVALAFTGGKAGHWKEKFLDAFEELSSPKSSFELIVMQAQAAMVLEKRVDTITSRVDQIEQRLVVEKINEFPDGCERLDNIALKFFPGMSPANVSRWLQIIKHPSKEYRCSAAGGLIQLSQVYVKNGLSEARERLVREATYEKTTPQNVIYNHPILGRFFIKKMSHLKSFIGAASA